MSEVWQKRTPFVKALNGSLLFRVWVGLGADCAPASMEQNAQSVQPYVEENKLCGRKCGRGHLKFNFYSIITKLKAVVRYKPWLLAPRFYLMLSSRISGGSRT